MLFVSFVAKSSLNFCYRTLVVSLLAAFPLISYSQPAKPDAKRLPVAHPHAPEPPAPSGGRSNERTITVDKNVTVSLCVTQGTLKINGWSRGEVRVFVKDGAKFAFQVLEKSMHSEAPGWIKIASAEPAKSRYGAQSECLWGDEIEIDAPVNSTITLQGQEATTTVDGVKKASVKMIGGDISLRNIAEGVTASTYQGDITVDESGGSMMLDTSGGNIVVFDAGPSQIGDIFRAKTNSGTLSLDSLRYRQIDVNSISGSVLFKGEILSGGTYALGTTKGSIKMSVPADSSFQVVALYGSGTFSSELPMKVQTEDVSTGPVKRQVGLIGKGGANVKLTSNSGSIMIKKK